MESGVREGRCLGCGRWRIDLRVGRPAPESRLPAGMYCDDCRRYLVRAYADWGRAGWAEEFSRDTR